MSIIFKLTHTNRRGMLRWIELIFSYTIDYSCYTLNSFHSVMASDGKSLSLNAWRNSLNIVDHHLYPHHQFFFIIIIKFDVSHLPDVPWLPFVLTDFQIAEVINCVLICNHLYIISTVSVPNVIGSWPLNFCWHEWGKRKSNYFIKRVWRLVGAIFVKSIFDKDLRI